MRLLDKQPQTQAPPVLLFSLGRVQFRCVLVDASQRFTMFLRDGTPVRSTMSVRLQEYVEVTSRSASGLFFGSPTASAGGQPRSWAPPAAYCRGCAPPCTSYFRATPERAGRRLPGRRRAAGGEIAEANAVDDPFDLPPGASLVIPAPGRPHRPDGRDR